MASKRKIYLREMREHDLATDDCAVRELEMVVDGVLVDSRYSQQFWRDVSLYGVDGAMAYLYNNAKYLRSGTDVAELRDRVERIKARILKGETNGMA